MPLKPKRSKHLLKNPRRAIKMWAAGIGVLCLIFIASALKLANVLSSSRTKLPITAGQETKGEPNDKRNGVQAQAQNNYSSQSKSSSSQSKYDNTETNVNLIAPLGDFVSAHHVSPSTHITSVCNTSSGAICKIVFTQGNSVISLQPEMTDQGGSAYWDGWTPKDIGLTSGIWNIKAVATLNGQTKTADDAMSLEVSQ